tara:strand:- start:424 stop:645 length:222 start_codon:yes stop_codon:yes gene_type:complete
MNVEERRKWHVNHRRGITEKDEQFIKHCIENKFVYQTAYELMFGNFYEKKITNKKINVLPRTTGGTKNGKAIF